MPLRTHLPPARSKPEIFLADEKNFLPMRRIVRGISRVYRGEAPEIAHVPRGAVPG
jgi:hypothetical protein